MGVRPVAAAPTRSRLATVASVETVEESGGTTEFVSAQVSLGRMRTKFSCEKGGDLGQACGGA